MSSPSKAWQSKHVPNIRRVPKSSDSEHSRGLQFEVTAHSLSKSAWRDALRLPLVPWMRYGSRTKWRGRTFAERTSSDGVSAEGALDANTYELDKADSKLSVK